MTAPNDHATVLRSARVYRRLLTLYPDSHQAEYGEAMSQLFRDQCRDAWESAGWWGLAKLWLRVLPDLAATSLLEHFGVLKERRSMIARVLFGSHFTSLTSFTVVFTTVFLLVFMTSAMITFLLPESYASTARIRIARDTVKQAKPADASTPGASYDPYFLQTEFEVIRSDLILRQVVQALNLEETWSRTFNRGEKLTAAQAIDLLRSSLALRPIRNTMIAEITAYSGSPREAAKLANATATAYRDRQLESNRESLVNRMKAMEDNLKVADTKVEGARQRFVTLRSELKIPSPEPDEGELLANYWPYLEARQQLEELMQQKRRLVESIYQEQFDLQFPHQTLAEILDVATPASHPSRPNKPFNLAVGALLGIILGSIAGAGTAGISRIFRRSSEPSALAR